MSSTPTILPADRQTVAQLSQTRNEPQWMTSIRSEAIELAEGLEWPRLEKMKMERWNLTSYGSYKKPHDITSFDELPEAARKLLDDSASQNNILIQHNSGVVFNRISKEWSDQGVVFMDLESALHTHGEMIKNYFMTIVLKEENRLTALHAALWNGGVFLYVPKNVIVKEPLQALFITDDPDASYMPHVLIIAESHSSVTYVDNFISSHDQVITHSSIAEVFVKPGAKVQFASVHDHSAGVTELAYRRAVVEQDASMEWILGEMSYGDMMSDTATILKGNGSSSDAKIISVGTGEQRMNITTRATHFGKSTPSMMSTRAVMRDDATSIINGITKIEKGATKSNGVQAEKVLMLSPNARGDANPILLIDEDDVKAGHAASVGQVNPDQIHYLMSRGITKPIAQQLIIYGFLAPVVSEIPIEKLRKQLQVLVERKLDQ